MSKKLMKDDELKKTSGGSWDKNQGIALAAGLASGLACLGALTVYERNSSKSYYKKCSGFVPVDFAGLARPFIYAIGTVASMGVGLTAYAATHALLEKKKENF